MRKTLSGFTIAEMLVVIVLIVILTTITAVSYTAVRSQADDAAVQSDLANLRNKLKRATRESANIAPIGSALDNLDWKATQASYMTKDSSKTRNIVYCYNSGTSEDRTLFAVIAISASGNIYYTTESVAPKQYTSATKPPFNETQTDCSTFGTQVSGKTYSAVMQGWYSLDTTTGPWRNWTY